MIRTRVCDVLGIEHPIFNAPMSGTATGQLAAAVSIAGGFGMIGGTSDGGADWLREQIHLVRSLTDRPFGVGFISSFPGTDQLVEVALSERVAAINHSFADPAPYVSAAHEAGVKVFAQVQTLSQAVSAAEAGVDLIVAQGGEAGGHGGTVGLFAILPAIVDAVRDVPVVAAGGIADGRGLAAALMLGADGVWMGTRFAASREWGGHAWEQEAILRATADDTVRTTVYDRIYGSPFPSGIADRMLRNEFIENWRGREDEAQRQIVQLRDELDEASRAGDVRRAGISAGVSSGLITSLKPAGDIIRDVGAEAERLLRVHPGNLLRSG